MKQLRNYGYVRTLANARWPKLKVWSHSAIGFFPILAILGLLTFTAGIFTVVLNFSNPLDFPEMGWPRVSVHLPVSLLALYSLICWVGAALGNSPHRSIATIFLSPIMIFLAHWSYGSGVLRGWRQIHFGGGASAGLGVQIDDKQRTV